MTKKYWHFPFLLIFLVSLGSLVSCQSRLEQATPFQPGITIGITDAICPNVIVKVGDQVTWINQGKDDHIVEAVDSSGVTQFSSGIIIPGDSFSMIFSEPLTYTYSCSTDGNAQGMVTVNH